MQLMDLYEKHEIILRKLNKKSIDPLEHDNIVALMEKDCPEDKDETARFYIYYKEDIKWLLGKYLSYKYNVNYK